MLRLEEKSTEIPKTIIKTMIFQISFAWVFHKCTPLFNAIQTCLPDLQIQKHR